MDRIIETFKVLLTGRNIVIISMVSMTGYGTVQVLGAVARLTAGL